MTAISDAVVIGLVLTLVFAAVSYYLYSQIGQLTHKVGLMENILLDLKVTTEQAVLSSSEPLEMSNRNHETSHEHFQSGGSFTEPVNSTIPEASGSFTSAGEARDILVESRSRSEQQGSGTIQVERADSSSPSTDTPSLSVNYEAMTYKELLVIARQKSIHGTRTMTKAQLIDAIRGSVSGSTDTIKKEETSSLAAWTTSGQASFNDEMGSADDAAGGSLGGGGILSLDDTHAGDANLVGSD
jgi:hypothetical protein